MRELYRRFLDPWPILQHAWSRECLVGSGDFLATEPRGAIHRFECIHDAVLQVHEIVTHGERCGLHRWFLAAKRRAIMP